VTLRGGIRFGPGVCGADGPGATGCTREDTAAAHADARHSDALGRYGGLSWPVSEAERDRWEWLSRPKEGPHQCRTPNAKAAAFSAGLRGDDPLDETWYCPECLQRWEIDVDRCGECGRADDPEWVRSREWAGQDTSFVDALLGAMLRPVDGHPMTPTTGKEGQVVLGTVGGGAITAAGGWCAPSEAVYDLALDRGLERLLGEDE
jgi:hypothetical protein